MPSIAQASVQYRYLKPQPTISSVCITGYWAPFKISQNLPKHSAATRAATWSLKTPAVCGDPQTSGMGTVLMWVVWLLEHSWEATGKRKLPLVLYWMDQGWWTDTAVCTSSEESSGLYPHGQTEHCLSDSDTVVHSISLIILLLTGYNHFFCFYFPPLHFHLVLFSICESANVY